MAAGTKASLRVDESASQALPDRLPIQRCGGLFGKMLLQELSSLLASVKLPVSHSKGSVDYTIASQQEWHRLPDLFRAGLRRGEIRLGGDHATASC
jgi:hypothetical protein